MSELKDSPTLQRVYQLYGLASHNCSNIEYRIAYHLLGPEWTKANVLTPQEIENVFDKVYKKTMGQLLEKFKNHYKINDEGIEILNEVLEKRNYLIHRFFGTYGKKMHDEGILKEMIKDLESMISLFQKASRSLDPEKTK